MNNFDCIPKTEGITKEEMLAVLLREEYGYIPSAPFSISARLNAKDERFCAGKGVLESLTLVCASEWGDVEFPFTFAYPKGAEKPSPAFIHINFRDNIPDAYQPSEEILDRGYAVFTFCYKNVTSDDGDFSTGIAGAYYKGRERNETDCGKIAFWAWAAMRLLDYALAYRSDIVRSDRISVIGHSRLGKTALLAGALDERFYCAISNNSGCGGAAIARGNTGEKIKDICRNFPFWFCKGYTKYIDNEDNMPFDQHFLVAANYPHFVYVASAELDAWACPENEYLSAYLASEMYEREGRVGLSSDKRELPSVGTHCHGGDIGYHYRSGSHYLSRYDWNMYIDYLNAKEGE